MANYSITGNEIEIEKFTGNDFNKGELLRFNSSDFESFIEAEIIIRKTYWLGTDRYGRDMLSRLMGGTWISFTVGFISILISLFIGISLGAIAFNYVVHQCNLVNSYFTVGYCHDFGLRERILASFCCRWTYHVGRSS